MTVLVSNSQAPESTAWRLGFVQMGSCRIGSPNVTQHRQLAKAKFRFLLYRDLGDQQSLFMLTCWSLCRVTKLMSGHLPLLSENICLLPLIRPALSIAAAGLIRCAKGWVKAPGCPTAQRLWIDIPHSHLPENA